MSEPQVARDRMAALGWAVSVDPDDCMCIWEKRASGVLVATEFDDEFRRDLDACMASAGDHKR